MARLKIGDKAPYAPGGVLVDLIRRHRNQGLPRPVDAGLLGRLGVSESLVPRSLAALRQLEFIDDDGNATEIFDSFKLGSETEYKERLGRHLREVYGEVFDVIGDLAAASPEQIETAFRGFDPHGQRPRMVVLFLSLCQEAGLVEDVVRARSSSMSRRSPNSQKKPDALRSPRKPPQGEPSEQVHPDSPAPRLPVSDVDPLIAAYVAKLPPAGSVWPTTAREKYLAALSGIFDIVYEEGDAHY